MISSARVLLKSRDSNMCRRPSFPKVLLLRSEVQTVKITCYNIYCIYSLLRLLFSDVGNVNVRNAKSYFAFRTFTRNTTRPSGGRRGSSKRKIFCFSDLNILHLWTSCLCPTNPLPRPRRFTQCCSCHATQQDGILLGRSIRQQSPAGPVNMRRNMRRL